MSMDPESGRRVIEAVDGLAVSGIAGIIGSLIRLSYPKGNRAFGWHLCFEIPGAAALGLVAYAFGRAAGLDDEWVLFALSSSAGMLGQAVMIDLARKLLSARFGVKVD